MKHFSPTQLAEYIKKTNGPLTLLDVREAWEFDICHIPNSVLIPMGEIADRLDELDKTLNIAVICHHGRRSLQIGTYLEQSGFQKLINLTGGVDAWAKDVDSSMPKY